MAAGRIKIQTFLSRLPLFRALAAPELERLALGTSEVYLARGDVVFHKGDPCVGFHAVVYGQVKLAFASPHGTEKVIEIMGPGSSFGEPIMFMDKPYIMQAQTLADTMLLHVSKAAVDDELGRDPRFARRMIAGLSRKLNALIYDLEAYSLHSGTQRVIGYLLRGEPESAPATQPLKVTLSANKATIASRLNLTPEHFSRILHDLAQQALITVEGRQILIHDIERLRAVGV
ncbi:MAG TPA: Crp/Fnr family transcriptional regulator [Burkholderiales bacterium]|nr:Crp/Fnr family transcriptional regulator [Burkholderiales bacterium]